EGDVGECGGCPGGPRHSSSVPFPYFVRRPVPTEVFPLSLHDALPISGRGARQERAPDYPVRPPVPPEQLAHGQQLFRSNCSFCQDRKSTRLNSSHLVISYAVFCLKKKIHRNMPLSSAVQDVGTSARPR